MRSISQMFFALLTSASIAGCAIPPSATSQPKNDDTVYGVDPNTGCIYSKAKEKEPTTLHCPDSPRKEIK